MVALEETAVEPEAVAVLVDTEQTLVFQFQQAPPIPLRLALEVLDRSLVLVLELTAVHRHLVQFLPLAVVVAVNLRALVQPVVLVEAGQQVFLAQLRVAKATHLQLLRHRAILAEACQRHREAAVVVAV